MHLCSIKHLFFADMHKNNVLVKNNLEIFTICRNHNTVIISSSVNFLTDTNGESFWIGLNDIDIENDWVWESDKSPLFLCSVTFHIYQTIFLFVASNILQQ
jgi:hypothetical protein